MHRVSPWDLLLVGVLVFPFVMGGLFVQTMWGLLTVEAVPADLVEIDPLPSVGDRVEVYGTWVLDRGHLLGEYGWNEIHPVVFIRNLSTGVELGNPECKLLEDVHSPSRLRILDASEPCKWARGAVEYVFWWTDGDWHIDLLLDAEFQQLANSSPPMVRFPLPMLLAIGPAVALTLGMSYVYAVVFRTKQTILGRVISGLFKK